MSPRRLTWRLVRRGALLWAVVAGVILLAGAVAYRAAYLTLAERLQFAATLGTSRGLQALYGRADRIDTVGGFVTWRYGTNIAVIVALWAVLATTRVLRGDEEAGRTELLLVGPTTGARLLAQQLAVLAGGVALVGAGVMVGCLAAGLPVAGSALFGLMTVAAGAAFVAVAAVASQLTRTRRRAVGVAGGILAGSYLLRAVGDASPGRSWIGLLSPLGWAERAAPFGEQATLVPIAALLAVTAVLIGVALILREHRDTGDSALAARPGSVRSRPVRSLTALDVLLNRGAFVGWTVGTAAAGLVLGFIATDVATWIAENETFRDQTDSLAGTALTTARGFLGLSFAVIAVVAALYAGTQLVAARRQEETTQLDNLLTAGAHRWQWLTVRLVGASLSLLGLTAAAGVAAWAGLRLSGGDVSLGDCLRGALNTLPVAALFLGLATSVFGIAPRAVTAVAYGSVAVAYAVLLVTSLTQPLPWLAALSPFDHLAPVPARGVDVAGSLVMTALGAVGVAVGLWSFERRDIIAE